MSKTNPLFGHDTPQSPRQLQPARSEIPGSTREDRHKTYMLTLLMVIMAFNFVDRFALGVLLQDIKVDLHLSDTQLGFMTGIAFALFYSVMGIPIARWADHGNRVTIIALTAAIWSVMVALCGRATSFSQLLLIRVGVAVGEAGGIPPAHSLMADQFTREERPRASAFYQLGVPLSLLLSYFAAGWLDQLYGWRTTFLLLGLPGVVLSALVWFTLKDPRQDKLATRLAARSQPASPGAAANFKTVCKTLFAIPSFRHLVLSFSIMYFFGYGVQQWQPSFFIRSFGLSTGELGTWFAIVFGGGGFVGTYLGGYLAMRYARGKEGIQLKGIAAMYSCLALLSVGIYLSTSMYVAFALLTMSAFCQYSTGGPLLSTIQTLVPERMRATAIALIYLFANLIGMGIGPLLVGVLSDAMRQIAGEESLRYSLLALSPGFLWVAWHLYRASTTVSGDIDRVGAAGATAPQLEPAVAV